MILQLNYIFQGQAESLYRNNKNSGFDLHKVTQISTGSKSTKALVSALAVLVMSGCVSQQSALDFNGAQIAQPVPTGVELAGTNLEATVPTSASNIPIKAPRPTADITSQTTVQTANSAQTTVAPQPATTLAIVETPEAQTPTANVIADATPTVATTPTTKTATVPQVLPTKTPSQNSVEVASLSPSVEAAPIVQAPAPEVVKKKGFFEKLFTPKEKTPRPVANLNKPKVRKTARASSRIDTASSVADRPSRAFKKSKVKSPNKLIANVRPSSNQNRSALPGVKSNSEIFGIKNETASGTKATQVAAVGSFGRLSPNGLRVQHSKVQVACLKPGVLRVLKMVERRYGKKPIITSGYRSPKGNRRAGGARNSQHIFCKAVDIQVEGVSKWNLAKYLRTLPGRGGVGTYCRTKSVHIDIGSKRDWHHPCRKSSKRKRKKA